MGGRSKGDSAVLLGDTAAGQARCGGALQHTAEHVEEQAPHNKVRGVLPLQMVWHQRAGALHAAAQGNNYKAGLERAGVGEVTCEHGAHWRAGRAGGCCGAAHDAPDVQTWRCGLDCDTEAAAMPAVPAAALTSR